MKALGEYKKDISEVMLPIHALSQTLGRPTALMENPYGTSVVPGLSSAPINLGSNMGTEVQQGLSIYSAAGGWELACRRQD